MVDRMIEIGRVDESQCCFTAVGSEAARDVWNLNTSQVAHDCAAEVLELLFEEAEVWDLIALAVADDDIGSFVEDRLDELRDILAVVLVVPIRVDDDIGSEHQAAVEASSERVSQAPVSSEADNMVDTTFLGDFDSSIGAAIIDDQDLDLIDARYLPRYITDRCGERVLFVEARDLNDDLHGTVRLEKLRDGAASSVSEVSVTAPNTTRLWQVLTSVPNVAGWDQ